MDNIVLSYQFHGINYTMKKLKPNLLKIKLFKHMHPYLPYSKNKATVHLSIM